MFYSQHTLVKDRWHAHPLTREEFRALIKDNQTIRWRKGTGYLRVFVNNKYDTFVQVSTQQSFDRDIKNKRWEWKLKGD